MNVSPQAAIANSLMQRIVATRSCQNFGTQSIALGPIRHLVPTSGDDSQQTRMSHPQPCVAEFKTDADRSRSGDTDDAVPGYFGDVWCQEDVQRRFSSLVTQI